MAARGFTYTSAGTFWPKATCDGYTAYSEEPVIVTPGTLATPEDFENTATNQTTADFAWSAVPEATSYTLTATPVNGGSAVTMDVFTTSGRLEGLEPGTAYTVTLVAKASGWNDSAPAQTEIVTQGLEQLATPTNVAASNIEDMTATISWDAVADATSYAVTATPNTGGSDPVTVTVSDTQAELTGLEPDTGYDVTVIAKAAGFEDSEPGTTSFTTLEQKLGTPENITASDVTDTTATVSWGAVNNATSYAVNYTPGGTEQTVTDPTIDLTGLTADTEYTVTVIAKAAGFQDSDAGTGQFTTAGA